jgi:hypothetical protein
LEKTIRLKIAAMMLFWFGIIFESVILLSALFEFAKKGTLTELTPQLLFFGISITFGIFYFFYTFLGHFIHIVAGYWLSKGRKKGIVVGLFMSFYEIISFFVPDINSVLYTPLGIAFRVFFAITIFLIITGTRDLFLLQSENWRPWKNPFSDKPKKF